MTLYGITSNDVFNGIKLDKNNYISETLVTHKDSNLKKIIRNVTPING